MSSIWTSINIVVNKDGKNVGGQMQAHATRYSGTKRLECIASDGTGRRVIHSNLNYPFSMVFYANHFYFTDWRRDGVIALSRDSSQFTDEYLPDQRSHLYGVTIATTHCL